MHGGEVRNDWKAFGKDKQEWSSRVTTVGLGVFEGTTAGGEVGKRGEREEVGKITGPPPTPSASLPAPVLSEVGGGGAMRL